MDSRLRDFISDDEYKPILEILDMLNGHQPNLKAAIKVGGEQVAEWYVHNKPKKRANPANYLAMTAEDARKLVEIKKIDKHIAIGFLLLKYVYAGIDAQNSRNGKSSMPRVYTHAHQNETKFENFIAAEKTAGREVAYVYFTMKIYQKRVFYQGFETSFINTTKHFDREPLMNTQNGEILCEIVERELDDYYRFEVLAFLLNNAIDGDIYIPNVGFIQSELFYIILKYWKFRYS